MEPFFGINYDFLIAFFSRNIREKTALKSTASERDGDQSNALGIVLL